MLGGGGSSFLSYIPQNPRLFPGLGAPCLGASMGRSNLWGCFTEHPRPWPNLAVFQVPGRLTQRWEHCTADLTFSTKVVTFVWYCISATEVSLFFTGQSREGRSSQCAGMATWWLCRHSGFREVTEAGGCLRVTCTCACSQPDPSEHFGTFSETSPGDGALLVR